MRGTQTPWTGPVIRWAGSKRKLLPALLRSVPENYNSYFEPFVGSGCLFFALRPNRAVLGDINEELISALSILRRHPRILHKHTSAHRLNRRSYYKLRDCDAPSMSLLERAARFLALNRHCFNGLYRTNRCGKFNVPIGRKSGTLPSARLFYRAAIALRQARFVRGDFTQTLKGVRPGDFVYLDPPYVYSARRDRGEYGPGTFTLKDLNRLFSCMRQLDKVGAFVLLSFLETDEILEKAEDWKVQTVPVKRQIAGFSEFRRTVNEVLICNYDLSAVSGSSPHHPGR